MPAARCPSLSAGRWRARNIWPKGASLWRQISRIEAQRGGYGGACGADFDKAHAPVKLARDVVGRLIGNQEFIDIRFLPNQRDDLLHGRDRITPPLLPGVNHQPENFPFAA